MISLHASTIRQPSPPVSTQLRLPPPRPTLFPYTTLFRSRDPFRARRLPAGAHLHHDQRGQVHRAEEARDRKSTRLNSSHMSISYAVFCLKKKNRWRWHWVLLWQCARSDVQCRTTTSDTEN